MKQQTLPTSIEYGQMLEEKVEQEVINHLQYFIYRREFDTKIMQQPHLSQFIPCVEENGVWRVLEKVPQKYDYINGYDETEHEYLSFQYQTALSKVLFSGWEFINNDGHGFIHIKNSQLNKTYFFSEKDGELITVDSLNDLTTLNLPLTETGVIEFKLKF